ncbi:MAG: hypothetical protein R3C99_24965 [Pirellulaceae bacterium]
MRTDIMFAVVCAATVASPCRYSAHCYDDRFDFFSSTKVFNVHAPRRYLKHCDYCPRRPRKDCWLIVCCGKAASSAIRVTAEPDLDTNELEGERGITILAKNIALPYQGVKINV